MKIVLIACLLYVNVKALVNEKQLDYLSFLAFSLKVSDKCRILNVVENHKLFSFFKVNIKVGNYTLNTNGYDFLKLCEKIKD